jgi:hypothetical protein
VPIPFINREVRPLRTTTDEFCTTAINCPFVLAVKSLLWLISRIRQISRGRCSKAGNRPSIGVRVCDNPLRLVRSAPACRFAGVPSLLPSLSQRKR